MTPLEDDVRERFASIAAPDVPAPPTALLRKRAHRIRATRMVAAAASIALVAAGVAIGTTTLTHQPAKSDFASGVTAIPGHVHGLPPKTKQWQFAETTLAGRHLVAVSFRQGKSICITGDGGGTCELANQIPSTVADVEDSSEGNIRSVVGFVPMSARTVLVHVGSKTSTVEAVRTPTSDTRRFFAAFFVKQADDDRFQPVVGVFDAQGKPVPPTVPDTNGTAATSPSHVAGLPAAQWSWNAGDGSGRAIAYRRSDGTPCVAMTDLQPGAHKVAGSPLCAASTPSSARVLLEETLPSGWILLVGDAPLWHGVLEWGPNGMSGATMVHAPAASDRNFWALDVPPGAGSRIATCAAGNNCISVADLAQILPHS